MTVAATRPESHTGGVDTTVAPAPLRIWVHLLIAFAVGVVSPFTGLAWPFAILVGMTMGSADAHRLRGEPDARGDSFGRAILVALGVLAMLFFGAIVGGIIAIAVVILAAFSERTAALASATDRGVARILLFIVPVVMWFVVFPLLGMNVDIRIGG